jgi:hypothetical protein
VTRSDVLSVYSRPDVGIQREITQDLILSTFLCDPSRFTVNVKDSIVTIEGTPETASVGHDIIDAIRHVEGAVAVRDRLSYPPNPEYLPSALSEHAPKGSYTPKRTAVAPLLTLPVG